MVIVNIWKIIAVLLILAIRCDATTSDANPNGDMQSTQREIDDLATVSESVAIDLLANVTSNYKGSRPRSSIAYYCSPDQARIIREELQTVSRLCGVAKRAANPASLNRYHRLTRHVYFNSPRSPANFADLARASRRYSKIQEEARRGNRGRILIRCDDPEQRCQNHHVVMYNNGINQIFACPVWFEDFHRRFRGDTRFHVLFWSLSECQQSYAQALSFFGHRALEPARNDALSNVDRPGPLGDFMEGTIERFANLKYGLTKGISPGLTRQLNHLGKQQYSLSINKSSKKLSKVDIR